MAEPHPDAALVLLDRYFALGEHFDVAQGFVDAAAAYLSLGKTEDAIHSLRTALDRERRYPNLKTQAWSKFALLVATKQLRAHFEEALWILSDYQSRIESRTAFPVEVFEWHAAIALIRETQGHTEAAKTHALKALDAARATSSGFRYHKAVGLVGSAQEIMKQKLLLLTSR